MLYKLPDLGGVALLSALSSLSSELSVCSRFMVAVAVPNLLSIMTEGTRGARRTMETLARTCPALFRGSDRSRNSIIFCYLLVKHH